MCQERNVPFHGLTLRACWLHSAFENCAINCAINLKNEVVSLFSKSCRSCTFKFDLKFAFAVRAVARALIWGGGGGEGGGSVYSYIRVMPNEFLLKSVVFKLRLAVHMKLNVSNAKYQQTSRQYLQSTPTLINQHYNLWQNSCL